MKERRPEKNRHERDEKSLRVCVDHGECSSWDIILRQTMTKQAGEKFCGFLLISFIFFYIFLHSFCFKVWSVWQTWDRLTHTGDSVNTHNGSVGQRYTQVTHYLLVLSDQQISIIRYPPIKGWQGFIFTIFSGHFIISVSSEWIPALWADNVSCGPPWKWFDIRLLCQKEETKVSMILF